MAQYGEIFQSTQPKRAATCAAAAAAENFPISIHAAQEGCDLILQRYMVITLIFQSTQPKRAATV